MRTKGTPKTGGRQKGTPNRANATLKEFIQTLIDGNRTQLVADIQDIDPYQRLCFLERLIGYVLPKQQATTPEAVAEAEYKQLERLIDTLPDKVIDEIANKILHLQNINSNGNKKNAETYD